jgi:hypothetical protein
LALQVVIWWNSGKKKFDPLNAASSGFFWRTTLQKNPEDAAFSGPIFFRGWAKLLKFRFATPAIVQATRPFSIFFIACYCGVFL